MKPICFCHSIHGIDSVRWRKKKEESKENNRERRERERTREVEKERREHQRVEKKGIRILDHIRPQQEPVTYECSIDRKTLFLRRKQNVPDVPDMIHINFPPCQQINNLLVFFS